jgi:exodeoxyribonuclease III
MNRPFTLLTWNVNGIRARLDDVLSFLAEKSPDVACLQETKCEDKVFPRVPFAELGYTVHIHGAKGYAGVATLSKTKPTEVVTGFRGGDPDSHCRILNTEIDGLRLYNLYVPNGTALGTEAFTYKLAWLARLKAELAQHYSADTPVILCGDFNIAPDERDVVDPRALEGCTHFSPQEHAALRELLAFGLQDCFRKHDDRPGQYTWWDYRRGDFDRNRGMRIDHVYASAPLYARCESVVHDKTPRGWDAPSDHIPVIATFRGP